MVETIAAISTPPGQGAVSLLRMSGDGAVEIAEKVFRSSGNRVAELPQRLQVLGNVVDKDGEYIDRVLLTVFRAPASYTGEDTVEISSHGGVLVSAAVLAALVDAGARPAEPGEFTRRAFINGKMDLTQAEAVMDLIGARTSLALRAANRQMEGKLGFRVEAMRVQLLEALAHLEAYIDFPEEGIDPDSSERISKRMLEVSVDARVLIDTAEEGRILREGLSIVIAGLPNAGKSSLLNLLLGFERAIVSDAEGTTRDTIEEMINIRGIPVRLIDTAGLRKAKEQVEKEGVHRARREVAGADLVLHVQDVSLDRDDSSPFSGGQDEEVRRIAVLNKTDLGVHPSWKEMEGVRISCVQESGVEMLKDAILKEAGLAGFEFGSEMIAVNARHRDCLQRACHYSEKAAGLLKSGESPEFVAIDVREALDAVGGIVGKVDAEELLGEIFSSFCIGK
ncbi:MAG: tRNA uridine-5-carboxymethylaminomethyl(34) synthesis GTPase MnmE [Verrucomicrobiaceae bacterium]|nr:tRNA uridine-5-carboxymethylaminomethyl(34) synthesis GTPase MnmE [Verrucomicrobiaceae bacterium]